MSTKHLAGYTLCQKHAKHFQKKHVPTPETGRKEEAALQAPTIQQDQLEEYTTETTEEDRMREQNEQTEENTEQDVQPAETEQSEETAFTENCADAGMVLELDFNALDDIVMNFLEGAEAEFTYHQAEIIRTAYVGLKTEHS